MDTPHVPPSKLIYQSEMTNSSYTSYIINLCQTNVTVYF